MVEKTAARVAGNLAKTPGRARAMVAAAWRRARLVALALRLFAIDAER
jgi:hypothetical protein